MPTSALLIVACDGSALRNPHGPGGWAWYASERHWGAGGEPQASNNQMELTAVLKFLEETATLPPQSPIRILVDSTYVRDCVTKWAKGWEKNGWRTKSGEQVKNVELIKPIVAQLKKRPNVSLQWVKGHSGHPLNDAADTRANSAAHAIRRQVPVETGPGWKKHPEPAARIKWPTPLQRAELSDAVLASVAANTPTLPGTGWWYWENTLGGSGGGYRTFVDRESGYLFAVLSAFRTAPSNVPVCVQVPAQIALLFTPAPQLSAEALSLLTEINRVVTGRNAAWLVNQRGDAPPPARVKAQVLGDEPARWEDPTS